VGSDPRPALGRDRDLGGTELRGVFVDVRTETVIDRPRREVAAFTSDPSNATEWYRNIRSVEWETSPPVVVGSRMRFRARFLGRDLVYTYEIRELVPGERLVMGTADGPFSMETTYTFEDAPGGGTRVGAAESGRTQRVREGAVIRNVEGDAPREHE
jgi:uncharacterized protein YndB with AHSA1/START domain